MLIRWTHWVAALSFWLLVGLASSAQFWWPGAPASEPASHSQWLVWHFTFSLLWVPLTVGLWRLSARDLAAINAYESVDSGLYVRRHLSVRCGATQAIALVYIARRRGEGLPRPGYIPLVVEAAREWQLPEAYIHALARWAPSRWAGARAKDTGEVG